MRITCEPITLTIDQIVAQRSRASAIAAKARPGDVVHDDVDGVLAQGGDDVVTASDDAIGAYGPHLGHFLPTGNGRHRDPPAPRQLDRGRPDTARRAVDQHLLPALHVRPLEEAQRDGQGSLPVLAQELAFFKEADGEAQLPARSWGVLLARRIEQGLVLSQDIQPVGQAIRLPLSVDFVHRGQFLPKVLDRFQHYLFLDDKTGTPRLEQAV